MQENLNSKIKNYCSICRHSTNHIILFETSEFGEFGDYQKKRQLVRCLGCDYDSFREETVDFWDIHTDHEGNEEVQISIANYPNSIIGHVKLNGLYNVPNSIRMVYTQAILAFEGKSNLLTGVGFRAIIEAICINENIKGNNLELKINNLVKNRLITEREAERLHSIRFLGNDSVHEMDIPSNKKLLIVLEIIENLLKNLYILDAQAKDVLDTIIKEYSEFEDLLWRSISKLHSDKLYSLKQILGKHVRRLRIELEPVEEILIKRINEGKVDFLKVHEVKSEEEQLYFFTGKEYFEYPF